MIIEASSQVAESVARNSNCYMKRSQDYSMKTQVVMSSGGSPTTIERISPLKKPPPRGEVLKEEEGVKRYVKVTYLDNDLMILRGRGASEVYRKTS